MAPALTFSSPVATLKTSSTTQPTARRAAPEECTSFQMVSLSTCGDSTGGERPAGGSASGTRRGAPAPALTPGRASRGPGDGPDALGRSRAVSAPEGARLVPPWPLSCLFSTAGTPGAESSDAGARWSAPHLSSAHSSVQRQAAKRNVRTRSLRPWSCFVPDGIGSRGGLGSSTGAEGAGCVPLCPGEARLPALAPLRTAWCVARAGPAPCACVGLTHRGTSGTLQPWLTGQRRKQTDFGDQSREERFLAGGRRWVGGAPAGGRRAGAMAAGTRGDGQPSGGLERPCGETTGCL